MHAATPLPHVWIAVRTNLRDVLEGVNLADLARRELPGAVTDITSDPEVWLPH